MYPHAGSVNHGCEAIIRTTLKLFGVKRENVSIYSSNISSDYDCGLNQIVNLISANNKQIGTKSFKSLTFKVKSKLFKKDLDDLVVYEKHKIFKKFDFAISIGGDNYCYPGMIWVLREQCKAIDYFNIPRILWGCSLDEKLIDATVLNELKSYKAIFVRESISKEILNRVGIINNVYIYPDPAFTLKTQECDFENAQFKCDGVIGINISPLMNRYADKGIISKNFYNLVDYILKNTDKNIALIPHVEQIGNSDLDCMREFYNSFKCDRVELVDKKYNCMQLKSLISKCEVFVGCRTHATIAAYSSCVPTLVVGYSNKSIGIARDIFNDRQNYVVNIDDLKSENILKDRFVEFYNNKAVIKEYLENIMPSYIKKTYDVCDKISKILKQ